MQDGRKLGYGAMNGIPMVATSPVRQARARRQRCAWRGRTIRRVEHVCVHLLLWPAPERGHLGSAAPGEAEPYAESRTAACTVCVGPRRRRWHLGMRCAWRGRRIRAALAYAWGGPCTFEEGNIVKQPSARAPYTVPVRHRPQSDCAHAHIGGAPHTSMRRLCAAALSMQVWARLCADAHLA